VLFRNLVDGHGANLRIKSMVDDNEITILFNLNPDGSEHDHSGAQVSHSKVDARCLLDPGQHRTEGSRHLGFCAWCPRQHGEVQVFGEAVRFDVALLETGAALEDPTVAENGIRTDAPQHPAEDVVLLDDVLPQSPFEAALDDLRATDHPPPPMATLSRSASRSGRHRFRVSTRVLTKAPQGSRPRWAVQSGHQVSSMCRNRGKPSGCLKR